MTTSFLRDKYNFWTHIFFVAMTIFALVYAHERFQADGAYYLFKVVNFEHFQIEHQRFILFFSQWLPLLGAKMGASLHTIILLNSVSNVIFFYVIFFYCVYVLKDRTAGIIVILFQCLGVLHLQFTPMYEIWYGTMLLVPIRSQLVIGRYYRMKDLFILGVLMIVVLFSHPLLFIPLLFILMLDVIEKWVMNWKLFFLVVITFGSWYVCKKLFISDYEAGKLSMLDTSWNKAYRDLLHPGYYWFLIKFFFTWYTIPVIVFIITFFMLYLRGAKRKAIFVAIFFCGHIALINFTHVMDPMLSPYFERMYMPLLPIVFFPFMYDIFTQYALRNAVGGILIAMVVSWRFARFIQVGNEYKAKTELVNSAIAEAHKAGGTKFILNPIDNSKWHCMEWTDWSLAMETMLRSAEYDKNRSLSIALFDDLFVDDDQKKLNDKNYMMRCAEIINDNEVNPKFFVMKDGSYATLESICR